MANIYEAFLIETTRLKNGRTQVDIEYRKDDNPTIADRLTIDRFSDEWLKGVCRHKCDSLNAPPADVPTGIIDITATEDVPVDQAAVAWMKDYSVALRAKSLVDLGVLNATNPKYTALLARLKTNFLPKYIELI